jgi:hypothetical protein
MTDEKILEIFRKCFPRGLPIKDEDVIYFALALLSKA